MFSYADLLSILMFADDSALEIADRALNRLSEDYTVTVVPYAVS